VSVEWRGADGTLLLCANLGGEPVQLAPPAGREIWSEGDISPAGRYGAWSVRWAIAHD
jgi:hypothetical protein